MKLLKIDQLDLLQSKHRNWINRALKESNLYRDAKWSESIAVGNKAFIDKMKIELKSRARGKKIINNDEIYQLRETSAPYIVPKQGDDLSTATNTYPSQN